MKSIFISVFLITFILVATTQETKEAKYDFIGEWAVKTNYVVVSDVFPIDDYRFGSGFLIDNSYLDNPNIYVTFDFIDEDLLYIYQQNEGVIRGFYRIIPNQPSAPSFGLFHLCIALEDKENRDYPIGLIMTERDDTYQISYELYSEMSSMNIYCVGEMIKQSERQPDPVRD